MVVVVAEVVDEGAAGVGGVAEGAGDDEAAAGAEGAGAATEEPDVMPVGDDTLDCVLSAKGTLARLLAVIRF